MKAPPRADCPISGPRFIPPGCGTTHPDGIIDRRFAELAGFVMTASARTAQSLSGNVIAPRISPGAEWRVGVRVAREHGDGAGR
jgi:hypothetical protein